MKDRQSWRLFSVTNVRADDKLVTSTVFGDDDEVYLPWNSHVDLRTQAKSSPVTGHSKCDYGAVL